MKNNTLKSVLSALCILFFSQFIYAGTIDMLTSGYSQHSWNSTSYNSSTKTISFNQNGATWGAWGWNNLSSSTGDWESIVAYYNYNNTEGGLQIINSNGQQTDWQGVQNTRHAISNLSALSNTNEIYFKMNNSYSSLTLKSVMVYTINTAPCTLNFYYTISDDGDKTILDSDFSYNKNIDDVKNGERSAQSQINLKSGVVATSRARVNFSDAGSYIFSFPMYIKESGSYDMPRVTVNGVQTSATTHTTSGAENYTYEVAVNVASAGTYSVQIDFGNTNEKVFFSTVDITKEADIPSNTYIFGNVDGNCWNATQGTALDYNTSNRLFTKIVNITGTFAFTENLAANNDNGGWDYVNNTRWGASSDNTTAQIGASNWNPLIKRSSSDNNYTVSQTGKYFVTVDWTNSRFSLVPVFTVSFSAGSNGTIAAEVGGSAISNNADVASGETVTFTATPSSGYAVADWTVNGTPQGSTNNTLDVIITANTTVSVSFEEYYVDNTIITGTSNSTWNASSSGASMTVSNVADNCGAIAHNVLQFTYSNMSGSNYYGVNIAKDGTYNSSSSSGATGFGFFYKTELSDDYIAFCFDANTGWQYKTQLAATNGAWAYHYFSYSAADNWNQSQITIYINGSDNGNNTHYSSGKFYMSEITATTKTTKTAPSCVASYALTINRNNNSYGTVSGASNYTENTRVDITATPALGYRFVNWTTSDGVTFNSANSATTYFTMPGSNVTIQANFEEDLVNDCSKILTIEAEDYIPDWFAYRSGAGVTKPTDGTYSGTSYVQFNQETEINYTVHLQAGNYRFHVFHGGSGNNKYFNLYVKDGSTNPFTYNGNTYGETTYKGTGMNTSGSRWTDEIITCSGLTDNDYIIGLYGNDGSNVIYDKIIIEAYNNTNDYLFCPDITHELTLNATNGTATSDQPDNSVILGGTTVTVTATPAAGYRFDHWEDGSSATISYKAEYAFTLNANTSLTAVFVADDYCRSVNTIEVEDTYLADGAVTGGTRFPASLSIATKSGSGNDYAGTCNGTGYVCFNGSGGDELYFAVEIPEAGDYFFYTNAGVDKEMYINVYTTSGSDNPTITYSGTNYRKATYRRLNESYGTEAFKYTETTSTLSLSAGTVIVGLYAGWSHACFDQLIVERVDGKSVFCPPAICTDETINASAYAFCLWNDKIAQQTSGQITVSGTSVQFDYSNNDTGAEWFYPVTLANAEYNFTITHTNEGSNQTFRIYKEDANGTIYYSGKRYLQVGTDHSLTADGSGKSYCNYIDLATGNYLLSLYCLRNTRFTSIQIESTTCNAVNTDTYSLTLSSGGNGTAISNQINNAKILSGTSVTLLATPNSGYRFVKWSDNNTDNPRTLTINANTSLTATFEAIPTAGCANTFTIDCTSPITPTSATVAAATTTEVADGHIINKDSNKELYYFIHIPDDGTYGITVVGSNHDKDQTLNIYSTDGALSGTVVYGGTTYTKKATFTANTTNSGQNQFYPIVATTNLSLTEGDYIIGLNSINSWSQFERIVATGTFCEYHTLTLNSNNILFGTAATQGKKIVGSTVTITATAEEGYIFTGWTVVSGGATLASLSNATTTFTMPNNDVEITASFVVQRCFSSITYQAEEIMITEAGAVTNHDTQATPTNVLLCTSSQNTSASHYSEYFPTSDNGYVFNTQATSSVYMEIDIPEAGYYDFNFYVGSGYEKNVWGTIYTTQSGGLGNSIVYDGVTYYQQYNSHLNINHNSYTIVEATESDGSGIDNKYLPAGKCIIAVYTGNANCAIDKITITRHDGNEVFCKQEVTYSSGSNGSLTTHTSNGVDFSSGDQLFESSLLQFTATPASGYGIEGWYVSIDGGEYTLQTDSKGKTSFEYTLQDEGIAVEVRFTQAYTLTLTSSPAAGGTLTGSGSYVEGQEISVTAVANSGYAFQNWTRSGYQVTVSSNFTYTMPAANTTLQANFVEQACSASYTIQCETDYLPTFTLPQDIEFHTDGDGTGTDLHYGSYHGTGYAAYKNHGGDLYYMLDIPQAGEYSITVYLTDGSNRWLNVFSTATTSHQNITYGGVTYYKIAADGDNMGNGSDQPFQTFSVTKTLAAGKHIIGVWAQDCYAAFDQIVVTRTDNSQVFCEQIQDLYLIGNIYGTNYLWNPNPGNHEGRMTRQSDGTYTIRTRIASSITAPYAGGTFAFSTVEGTWDEVNAHRFGPSETTVATSYGNTYAYSEQNNSNNWSVPVAGTYTITLNPKTHSFRIDGPELYFNGQSSATNYSESNYQLMEYNQTNNVYTLVTRIANSAAGTGNGTASFTVDIAGDATYINNNRYGPASANATPAAEGATNTIALNGENKFSAAAGWYYIEVDLESSPKTARFYPTCEPRAMDIWTGSVPVSENYTGVDELGETVTLSAEDQNWWLRQVVLGPEHFQTAHVGDTLRVFYTSITADPKGGLHKTNNYDPLSTDGTAYHVSDNTEVSISDGETYVLKSFSLPANGYYHIITASSLAELKTRGVVVKGKGHTITKIALHPICDEDERRVNADLTNVATSVDLRDDPYLIGDVNAGGFNLGEWEHQLAFPRQNFTHVAVGDYVNVYVSITDVDATISFRCNVESIIADDKQGGEGCPSYGDVSFDRTIDNLDGDAPVVIGDNNYSVITMEVTEDMKRRLDQTGFIIAGKGALVYRVESVTRLFVIGSESTIEEKRVPTVVHDLVIWQGSQASNTDDIDVRGSITYVRPSVGGMHTQTGTTGVVGNTIDQWYTFALPFEVSAIKVYDKTDLAYYDGIQSIYRTDANDSGQSRAGGNNPLGRGFFYFNWLKAENLTGVLEVFRARWEYVDSETSESITAELNGARYGYPIKLYPYIIMFTDWGGTDTYFSDNNEVRFVGGPQLVRGTSDAVIITEDGEYFYYYPNNTLHSMTITGSAYKLNETNNRFYLEDNPVIPPFECYIQATSRYKALHRSISFTNFVSDDEPDVPTQIDQNSMDMLYEWIAQNAEVRVLDPTGKLVRTLQLGTGELQQLPKGVYMLQNGKTTVKVIL